MSDASEAKQKQTEENPSQGDLSGSINMVLNALGDYLGKGPRNENEKATPSRPGNEIDAGALVQNFEAFRKLQNVIASANYRNDPRAGILTAIKPYLNHNRQKKIERCLQIIQMYNVIGVVAKDKELIPSLLNLFNQ